MTTECIGGQRQTGAFTTECPDIAITSTLNAPGLLPLAPSRPSFSWRGIPHPPQSSKADCNGDNACLEAPIARRPSQHNVGI